MPVEQPRISIFDLCKRVFRHHSEEVHRLVAHPDFVPADYDEKPRLFDAFVDHIVQRTEISLGGMLTYMQWAGRHCLSGDAETTDDGLPAEILGVAERLKQFGKTSDYSGLVKRIIREYPHEATEMALIVDRTGIRSRNAPRWRSVKRGLLEMMDEGIRYTNLRDLANRTGCGSTAPVKKAIDSSPRLTEWAARDARAKRRIAATSEREARYAGQSREANPLDAVADAEAAKADEAEFQRLLAEIAAPEEVARLQQLSQAEKRELVRLIPEDLDARSSVVSRGS